MLRQPLVVGTFRIFSQPDRKFRDLCLNMASLCTRLAGKLCNTAFRTRQLSGARIGIGTPSPILVPITSDGSVPAASLATYRIVLYRYHGSISGTSMTSGLSQSYA